MRAELIDFMGNDLAVVNAARVSFDKRSNWECQDSLGFLKKNFPNQLYTHIGNEYGIDEWGVLSESDQKLIQYLAKHNHWTPFSHTAITLRMAAPIPIRTQCFKHKVGLTENEESRRYISSTPELYIPEFFRSKPEGSIKQGSGEKHPNSDEWLWGYKKICEEAIYMYESMIEHGVCPEQARFVLPQGVLVNWIWTGNLYSFANFYNKRTEEHAQKEIQELAHKVSKIIEPLFPVSWRCLTSNA